MPRASVCDISAISASTASWSGDVRLEVVGEAIRGLLKGQVDMHPHHRPHVQHASRLLRKS
jgi:hypothetical protein